MALATQHFDLYIIPNTTPPPVLDISQYDTSRTFVGHVKDIHGKPYTLPNNTTALLEGRNGNGIIFRLNVTVSGDTLTFTPDDILTDTSGRIHATISLDSTGQYLSPLRIIFNVQRAGITKEERTTNPDFKDAVAAAFQAYIDEHGSGGGGGSGEMNVQSDWNQGNINADDYIKNKPTKLSQFQNDSGFITSGQIPTELPTVTSSDNGKVLGVSNGAWDKITPSSGSGVPTGGSVGQVLTKTSSGSTWSDVPTELPSGGSTGQVLKKTSSGVAWQNESSGGSSITVDSALSTTSTNPVQNKVVTNAINAKGTYSKPSGGIPKTDLASAIQTSLGKADTALQTPSSYTNGQVLMVQNGSWVASNPPTELPSDGSVGQVLKRTASGVEWGNEQGGSGGSLPSGGTTGQVLTKTASGSTWADAPEELPSGGTTGQVLKKTASGIAWQNESSGSGSSSDMFVIHLTGDATSGYQITESAADIMAHYPNIMLVYEIGFTDEYYLVGARLAAEEMWGYLWFVQDENWMTDGSVNRSCVDLNIVWDTENSNYGVSAYCYSTALRKLPQASNVQNGKVLGVVGGKYAFVNDRLPTAAAADVGKVPTVNASGNYQLQTPSSGSGAFEIPVASTTSGGVTTYSTTATFAEIMANYPNLIVHYTNTNLYYTLSYTATSDPNSWYRFVFSAEQPGRNSVLETEWIIVDCENNTVTVSADSLDIKGLPAVSTADNDKFLRVVNGAWTAQTVQTWQGGNY